MPLERSPRAVHASVSPPDQVAKIFFFAKGAALASALSQPQWRRLALPEDLEQLEPLGRGGPGKEGGGDDTDKEL